MWARLMTQLVHTHRACVHIPCVSCVLVIVSMADLRPHSFEPQHGLDERVDEAADSNGGDDASVYDDSEKRVGNTVWCSCGMCSAMPTAAECLCCQEVHELAWKLQDLLWITQHENFAAVCLNEDVLWTALVSMIDLQPLTCRLVVQTDLC